MATPRTVGRRPCQPRAVSRKLTDMLQAARAVHLPSPEVCRSLRLASGLTEEQVGELVGADRATVARWELGTRTPRGQLRERYAAVLSELRRIVAEGERDV